MSFQEKNIAVSLATFTLIMGFFLISVIQMIQGEGLRGESVFWLWGKIAVLATFGTIGLTIATHVVGSVLRSIGARRELPIEHLTDERDEFITLKGTEVAYRAASIGTALAMLTLVFGQPPLVMFTLLIFFGILAQILADLARLYSYRQGV